MNDLDSIAEVKDWTYRLNCGLVVTLRERTKRVKQEEQGDEEVVRVGGRQKFRRGEGMIGGADGYFTTTRTIRLSGDVAGHEMDAMDAALLAQLIKEWIGVFDERLSLAHAGRMI